jgi:hypothetical protein
MRGAQFNPGLTQGRADTLYRQVFNVRAFGAKGDGTTNDIAAFQNAVAAAKYNFDSNQLRPAKTLVWAPPGRYAFQDVGGSAVSIVLPEGVELRGSYGGPPTHGQFSAQTKDGTTFVISTGANQPDGPPFIQLNNNCAVRGISLFWPNQTPDAVPVPYPYAFARDTQAGSAVNVTIENIEFQNAYRRIDASFLSRHLIRNVVGQALSLGIFMDGVGDVGRPENVHFIPIWSGFFQDAQTGATTPTIAAWQFQNGTAFWFKKADGEMVTNCFAILYNIGVRLSPSTIAPYARGSSFKG